MSLPTAASPQQGAFRHEALLYEGDDEFVALVAAFVSDGVAAGEPTLVVVDGDKIDRLRARVDGSELVRFADMAQVGRNPARIIPAWRAFADAHAGGAMRGVGEPISAARSHDELVECQQHESLLNMAFADTPDFWLLCPYDTAALRPDVIDVARGTHPLVRTGDKRGESETYHGDVVSLLDAPLPEPTADVAVFPLRPGRLRELRSSLAGSARTAGLDDERVADLVVAANEIASNSLLFGGGHGAVRLWRDDAVVCEVRDAGTITDPLIGRRLPGFDEHDSRGLWMVNQLCDLVQVRSSAAGTVVRLHVRPD